MQYLSGSGLLVVTNSNCEQENNEISPEGLKIKSCEALSVARRADLGSTRNTQNCLFTPAHSSSALSWLPQMEVQKPKGPSSYQKQMGLLGSLMTTQKRSYERQINNPVMSSTGSESPRMLYRALGLFCWEIMSL